MQAFEFQITLVSDLSSSYFWFYLRFSIIGQLLQSVLSHDQSHPSITFNEHKLNY